MPLRDYLGIACRLGTIILPVLPAGCIVPNKMPHKRAKFSERMADRAHK